MDHSLKAVSASIVLMLTMAAAARAVQREARVPVGTTSLYARDIGHGRPVIVLHGGPDFDVSYLLPDLDRLADAYRLIYYDQRGRGKSAEGVQPDDVTLASDVDDVDRVRQYFQLDSTTVLGHSWGAVIALEYALRYPERVARLIILNPAPASTADRALLRAAYISALGDSDMARQRALIQSPAYQRGDPAAVTARYRIHFEHALVKRADYERLMARMAAGFERQGADGIVKARAVENRLMRDTWDNASYDLMPRLRSLHVPTVVITGDQDFIPRAIAEHIAGAMPNARLVVLPHCGHFSYLECPDAMRAAIDAFFRRVSARPPR